MRSSELVKHSHNVDSFTTKTIQRITNATLSNSQALAKSVGFGTPIQIQQTAINKHNILLQSNVGATLSTEQVHAAEHLLSQKQLSIAVGIAGAGKSTMLAAANEAWKLQGRRVMGGALSGKAADGLQASSNIQSRTLASWLQSWKNGYHEPQIGDVFVLDEAGMVGSEQLLKFIEAAQQYKMKLVLVGDPEQLQPINAGTPLKNLAAHIPHANLTHVLRQQKNWQRQATLDFAQQRTNKALEAYGIHGAIITSENTDQAMATLVEDYMQHWELYSTDESRIALAYRRKDVHALNQYIRMAKQTGGELTNEKRIQTDHGPRAFAEGDRIVFTQAV